MPACDSRQSVRRDARRGYSVAVGSASASEYRNQWRAECLVRRIVNDDTPKIDVLGDQRGERRVNPPVLSADWSLGFPSSQLTNHPGSVCPARTMTVTSPTARMLAMMVPTGNPLQHPPTPIESTDDLPIGRTWEADRHAGRRLPLDG
jgi:hypothetical protein